MCEKGTKDEDDNAIWQIGVFDVHCHPTDIMASIDSIANMKAKVLTVMATRSQDQELVAKVANEYPLSGKPDFSRESSKFVVPAFGWHPWFTHQMYDDRSKGGTIHAVDHYKSVLSPEPDDEEFLNSLPTPRPLSKFLEETETKLRQYPLALIGEVGIDRPFRVPKGAFSPAGDISNKTDNSKEEYTPGSREGRPLTPYRVSLEHQKLLLRSQLELGAKYRRACSVHSVQAHGVVFDLLQSMWKGHEKPSKRTQRKQNGVGKAHDGGNSGSAEDKTDESPLPFPPRVCMHSYSGPPDTVRQLLGSTVPVDVYFSFSEGINFSSPSAKKVEEVMKTVADDRILVESDFHCAGDKMDELLKTIIVKVCDLKGWSLTEGTKTLRTNWEKFIFGD